jgi:hypothetical protein
MKRIIAFAFLFAGLFAKAQDSVKVLNHEIGFNTVSLVKQMISNSPSTTLQQLPYDFFYNIYYKDKVGLRLGAGISTSNTETEITGQKDPRITIKRELDYRVGVSYNFVNYKKVTLNGFVDYAGTSYKTETSNTSTVQAFPNPVQTLTTETLETTKGSGFQAGVGVKYNLHKHLALYAELPFMFMTQKLSSTVTINDTGTIETTTSSSKVSTSQVFIPTTVYLVLRF